MTDQNAVMIGPNRTGMALAPERGEAMLAGRDEFYPSSEGDASAIIGVRMAYAEESDMIGTVPPPVSIGGVAKTAVKALKGEQPTLFLDKLGERLAFERTGTRLYEALLGKLEKLGGFEGGPTAPELVSILKDEYEHHRLLHATITRLKGDPTAITPSANIVAMCSQGIAQVLVDPRTTVLQCLEAIAIAELVDNDCWEALAQLAKIADEDELVEKFNAALDDERTHLTQVRLWVAAGQGRLETPKGTR